MIMKKTMIYLVSAIAFLFTLAGCEEVKINENRLPDTARTFIKENFPHTSVLSAEKEREDGQKQYNVRLADGTEIEFNEAGEWTEIDCDFATIPDGVLPEKITGYIAANYPQTKAYKAEKKFGGYEITITGGYKLFFNNNGDFIR